MKKLNLLPILAVLFTLSFVFVGCDDAELTTEESLIFSANEEAESAVLSDKVISDARDYVEIGLAQEEVAQQVISATDTVSVTITVEPLERDSFPKTITVDFGSIGFVGLSGNVYKGKLIVEITQRAWVQGATRHITYENLYVNGNEIDGYKTVTNEGLNAADNWVVSIVARDTITRTLDGKVVVWNCEREREWFQNGTPLNLSDDWFSITGAANGINAKGNAYTMEIDSLNPLIIYVGYPRFVKGSVTTVSQGYTAVVDFGDGTKDKTATITIGDATKEFTLN